MAARRLIVVMLALLVLSSIAAALVPVETPSDSESSTQSTTTTPAPPPGALVHATVRADAREPERVRIELGDQLVLRVTSPRAAEVEIARLGELADVDPDAPARFDLLPPATGTYAVRLIDPTRTLDPARTIGRIEVKARRRDAGKDKQRRSAKDPS